jgi:hypothetical protein
MAIHHRQEPAFDLPHLGVLDPAVVNCEDGAFVFEKDPGNVLKVLPHFIANVRQENHILRFIEPALFTAEIPDLIPMVSHVPDARHVDSGDEIRKCPAAHDTQDRPAAPAKIVQNFTGLRLEMRQIRMGLQVHEGPVKVRQNADLGTRSDAKPEILSVVSQILGRTPVFGDIH